MRKKLVLGFLVVLAFSGLVAGQTLENFESSFDDDFEKEMVGGESFNGTINFSSGVGRSVPVVLEVTVDSEDTSFATGDLKGEEFDVSMDFVTEDFDWKPAAWKLVQRGDWEIVLADESVRENESIPEAVLVTSKLDDLPDGFSYVNSSLDLDGVDLAYDPDTTPGETPGEESRYLDYTGEAGYLPLLRPEALRDESDEDLISPPDEEKDFDDVLSASDYILVAPVLKSSPGDEVVESVKRVDSDTLSYRFVLKTLSVFPGSENTVFVNVSSNHRVKPDNFDFSMTVKSEVGVVDENVTEEVSASKPEVVEVGSSNVNVNASADANVTVQSLADVSTNPPENRNFVGGVSVDVSNSSGQVKSSGVVSITYDDDSLDDNNLDVYYYNDTTSTWIGQEGTQYASNNTVVAEVDHFSTYAAFAEPEPEPESESEADSVFFTSGGPSDSEPVSNDTQDDSEDQAENETDGQETDDNNSQDQNDQETQDDSDSTESSEQDPVQRGNQGITGLVTANPGGTAIGLISVLVAMLAVLQYTGRIKVQEALNYFQSS